MTEPDDGRTTDRAPLRRHQLTLRGRVRRRGRGRSSDQADPDARLLRRGIVAMCLAGLAFALLEAFIFVAYQRAADGLTALALAAFTAGLWVASRRDDHASIGRLATGTSLAILVLVLLLASLHPNKAPFAVAVILAVLVAVPYVDERTVRRLGVAAWLASVAIGLLDALAPAAGGIPGSVGAGLRLVGLAAASGITLLAIGHLSARLHGLVLRYRGLFDRVPVGVYRTTPEGRFLDVNRAFATMLGYDAPDELRERSAADLYAEPGQRERFRAALEADDTVREIELRVRRRDGKAIWVRDSANLVRDRAGRPLYYEGVIQDVTERRRSEARLERRATLDPLTGLVNRAVLETRLSAALARAREEGGTLAVLFLDLDDFKRVNDVLGHAVGDEVLTRIARRLRQTVRGTDIVGRFGGDEFVALLEAPTDSATADALAERLVEAVRAPILIDGEVITLGASVGVALSDGSDAPAALVRRADAAMYRAKASDSSRIGPHHVTEAHPDAGPDQDHDPPP